MIFVVILSCLFPLAAYCLLLAGLNRRPHPVVVAGSWDFAGVLFAACGFLLIAGPLILANFSQQWRDAWLYNSSIHAFGSLGRGWWCLRLLLWFGYFALVLGGSIWLLRRRRFTTSIYNIEPEAFYEVFAQVLVHLEMEGRRIGNQLWIGPRDLRNSIPDGLPVGTVQSTALSSAPAAPLSGNPLTESQFAQPVGTVEIAGPLSLIWERRLVVEMDPFPVMCHMTLRWPADADPQRSVIETELARLLREVHTATNPARSWLLRTGAILVLAIFLTLVLLILFLIQQRLHSW